MKKKKVSLISQGCRLNHAETAALINEFSANGYDEVNLEQQPDVVVINTCTVTENGDKDTIKLVRKINKTVVSAKIALIGCQSQIKKDQLMVLDNVHWVIGNESKEQVVSIIQDEPPGVFVNKFKKQSFVQPFSSFDPKHTRVNLKIQDGCDFYCSFCIIPFARGPARSRQFDNILEDAKALINMGVKELVLTGINLGTYHEGNYDFYDVLDALLELSPKTRIRISSIEPTTIDERLIERWKQYPNFCRYLHIPVQSGTNEVLQLMRRKYTLAEFDAYIKQVKKAIPDICIGTDVIVGFPGETDDLFKQTKDYLIKAPINYFHVFSYSERTMAHSRKFEHQVDVKSIKCRSQKLRSLSQQKWNGFRSEFLNQSVEVLFEQKKGDYWVGSTECFMKVKVKSDQSLKNKVLLINLLSINDQFILGEFV